MTRLLKSIGLLLVLGMLAPPLAKGQGSTDRPDRLADDIKQVSLAVEEMARVEADMGRRLEKVTQQIEDSMAERERLPAGSRQWMLANDKIRELYSEGMRVRYEAIHKLQQARDVLVNSIDQVLRSGKRAEKMRFEMDQKIAQLQQRLQKTEAKATKLAVLLKYGMGSTSFDGTAQSELDRLATKVKIEQAYRGKLENVRKRMERINRGQLFTRLSMMKSYVQQRFTSLDYEREYLETLAHTMKYEAELRGDMTAMQTAWSQLKDYNDAIEATDTQVRTLWGQLGDMLEETPDDWWPFLEEELTMSTVGPFEDSLQETPKRANPDDFLKNNQRN